MTEKETDKPLSQLMHRKLDEILKSGDEEIINLVNIKLDGFTALIASRAQKGGAK